MATSLTREKLLEKCKQRRSKVEVPGFGVVTLRRYTCMQRSRRIAAKYNEHGKPIPLQLAMDGLYTIIDQVCTEAGDPMFTDADLPTLGELDPAELDPLLEAIDKFNADNGDDDKKKH